MLRSSRILLTTIALVLVIPLAGCAAGAAGSAGSAGSVGANGADGADGIPGVAGADGASGAQGQAGTQGPAGAVGPRGAIGPAGAAGQEGPMGVPGAPGPAGDTGADGSGESALFYSDGFDNSAVAQGEPVVFFYTGPSTTSGVVSGAFGGGQFYFVQPGVYRVSFQVSTNSSADLVLAVNGVALNYTRVHGQGESTLSLTTLVDVMAGDSISVINPLDSFYVMYGSPFMPATVLFELVKAN